jgi:transcription antitermination factor NusG
MSYEPFWHVVYTMPRNEKKIASKLNDLSYNYYLPLIQQIKEYKNKKQKIEQPIFPGYIFVYVKPGFRHHITNIKEVLCFVKFNNEYAKIKEDEINALKILLLNLKDASELLVKDLSKSGQLCEIKYGALKGFKGKIIGKNGSSKLKVEISGLNKMVIVRMDDIIIHKNSLIQKC